MNKLLNDFWKRWASDYLLSLRESHNCMVDKRGMSWPRARDVSFIHDDSPQSKWKLGKIISLHKGRDGISRVAELKTSSGITTCPIVRLYPLEQGLEDGKEQHLLTQQTFRDLSLINNLKQAVMQPSNLWQSKIQSGQI